MMGDRHLQPACLAERGQRNRLHRGCEESSDVNTTESGPIGRTQLTPLAFSVIIITNRKRRMRRASRCATTTYGFLCVRPGIVTETDLLRYFSQILRGRPTITAPLRLRATGERLAKQSSISLIAAVRSALHEAVPPRHTDEHSAGRHSCHRRWPGLQLLSQRTLHRGRPFPADPRTDLSAGRLSDQRSPVHRKRTKCPEPPVAASGAVRWPRFSQARCLLGLGDGSSSPTDPNVVRAGSYR